MNDEQRIKELRKRILITAYRGGAAHLAASFSALEIIYTLYSRGFVRYDVENPWKDDRDRLVLSKGHACLALYVVLNEIGMISDDELNGFCRPGSHLGGEPKCKSFGGVEASTGSLGHGLSFAVGIALGSRIRGYNNMVYVVLGDGECEEGSVWEAAMCAACNGLDNLMVIIDDNKLQAMGTVHDIMGISDWKARWEAFGFDVKVANGHSINDLESCLIDFKKNGKPKLLIANTIKGKGVSFMESVPIWHYRMPNDDEMRIALKDLGISDEEAMECGILI